MRETEIYIYIYIYTHIHVCKMAVVLFCEDMADARLGAFSTKFRPDTYSETRNLTHTLKPVTNRPESLKTLEYA